MIRASDGFQVDTMVVDVGKVPGRSPELTLWRPTDGTTFTARQAVTLEAIAYDVERGWLSGSDVRWSSNIAGELGTGARLTVVGLPAGEHIITVSVEALPGPAVSRTTTIVVAAPPTPEG